uniref:Resistant to spore killer n=1 Tax=Neurospora intermedia TaxID=5142 RepID=I6W5F9_NEUIN|nr:resistant to spore killer [Neurospora intermedia]
MLSSFFGTGHSVLQPKTPSRQAKDDNRAILFKGPDRNVQRLTSHGGINAHKTSQQPKCPLVVVQGCNSVPSNQYYPPLNQELCFGPCSAGLNFQHEDVDIPTDVGKVQQSPPTLMNRFKYLVESFHYPVHVCREPTMFYVDIERNVEWHIQLRHYFFDLDQQLQELEHFLSSSSSANIGNMDDNTNLTDTAALANWTTYETATTKAGLGLCFPVTDSTDLEQFPNLRYCQRSVFSQQSIKGQLTGRWLIVAYAFASTYEAARKLDVKALLSSGCSSTVSAAHGTGSCSGTNSRTHYNTGTMLALLARSWDPHSCIRSGNGPAPGDFYQLERRKKMASEYYIYRYGGGGGITTTTTTTSSTASTPTIVETEDKAADTTFTSSTMTTNRSDVVEQTETGNAEEETDMFPTVYYDPYQRKRRPRFQADAAPIGLPIPQELEDRCHLIDRLWPALMTGQYMPPQATTDSDALEWDWTDDWQDTSTE